MDIFNCVQLQAKQLRKIPCRWHRMNQQLKQWFSKTEGELHSLVTNLLKKIKRKKRKASKP